jgi:hypothetical protein
MATAVKYGWVALPSGAEVLLERSVPVRLWTGDRSLVDKADLLGEIAAVSGFRVRIGAWEEETEEGELEAPLTVSPSELGHVLECLATAAAAVFYDRYRKPIEAADTDWDDESYAQDFDVALRLCGIHWGQVDEGRYRDGYCTAMHLASRELARQAH